MEKNLQTPELSSDLKKLGLLALEEINNNVSDMSAVNMLINHPYLKKTIEVAIRKNQKRLDANLIPPDEAELMATSIVWELLKGYNPEKKAKLKTYLARYLPLKYKNITRQSVAKKCLVNVKEYSKDKDKCVSWLKDQLIFAKQKGDLKKISEIRLQIEKLGADYERYLLKHLENSKLNSPEDQFVQRERKKIQKKAITYLRRSISRIRNPVERILKRTWLDILTGKHEVKPIITQDHLYKVKPAKIIQLAEEKFNVLGIDAKEFIALTLSSKYYRLQKYIGDIQKKFELWRKRNGYPDWKFKYYGSDWINTLILGETGRKELS
ncbi:MAG: hypothetical protein KAW92_05570 [Candidatus Cloacimonetes bacterium]|nr:hypothetical protein [Candidatus Cloacimonadota bacterium]